MSLQDAANLIEISKAKADIANDKSLSFWGRMKAIESIDAAAELSETKGPAVTIGDVVRGAVGAGLGYGVGAAVGSFLGFSPDTKSKLKMLGAGLGTLLNTGVMGMDKTAAEKAEEQEVRDAVRLGFLKGAHDCGLLNHPAFLKHGFIALTPETFAAPARAISGATSTMGTLAGSGAATVFGDDETDEKISKIMLEKRLMERQADKLRQQRKNKIIAGVLSRRIGDPANTTRY